MADARQVAKLAYALIDYYVLKYKTKFGRNPDINRFKNKYGFQDMISDVGFDRAKKIIEHYIAGSRQAYNVNDLLYNYDKINIVITQLEEDEVNREKLRLETKRRVEEWEAKNG